MTVAILAVYKIARSLELALSLPALVCCGVCALLINFLSIPVAPYLTEFRFVVLGVMVLGAAILITGINHFVLHERRLQQQATAASVTPEADSVEVSALLDIKAVVNALVTRLKGVMSRRRAAQDDSASEDSPLLEAEGTAQEELVPEGSSDTPSHEAAESMPVQNTEAEGEQKAEPVPEDKTEHESVSALPEELPEETAVMAEAEPEIIPAQEIEAEAEISIALEAEEEAQAEAEPEAEIVPEAVEEAELETEAIIHEIEEEAEAETEPEAVEEAEPETEAITPEIEEEAEAETEPEAEIVPEAVEEAEPDTEAITPEIEEEAETETEPEAEMAPETVEETEPETEAIIPEIEEEAETEPEAEMAPETVEEAEPETEAVIPEIEEEAETEPEAEMAPETVEETEPETEAITPDIEEEAEAEPEAEMAPETVEEAKPETEAVIPEIEEEAETEAEPHDENTLKLPEADAVVDEHLAASQTLDDVLDYAFELKGSSNWTGALQAYNYALKQYREDAYAPFLVLELVNIHKDHGHYDDALQCFYEALDIPAVANSPDMLAEFEDSMIYLEATQEVLKENNQPNIPFFDISKDYMSKIEALYNDRKSRSN